jgi:hypothetical protein
MPPDLPDPFDADLSAVHSAVEDLTGPFETERQARELPAVRAVYSAFRADPGVGKMTPHNQRMLLDALAGAGVYLGTYDHRIVEWLAGWEPQTVAVIAGWVQRASEADQSAARDELARMRDGPAVTSPPGRPPDASSPPPPPCSSEGSVTESVSRGGGGGDPR